MQGKSTIVLVYATWCPKCNQWSGPLFEQVRDAAANAPTNVIAINVDGGFSGGYVQKREFIGPNIYHGHDPSMTKKLGLKSDLFNYVVFGPDGKMVERGSAGMRVGVGDKTMFTIAAKLIGGKYPGEFRIFTKEMSPEVKQVLAPIEVGQPITEKRILAARGKLDEPQQEELNAAIRGYLDKYVEKCREGSKGDIPAQIEAYELAEAVSESFGSTTQGKQCQAYIDQKDADPDFKKEMSAAKAYQGTLRKAAANPRSAPRMMKVIASRFDGTHYGDLAAKVAETGQLPE